MMRKIKMKKGLAIGKSQHKTVLDSGWNDCPLGCGSLAIEKAGADSSFL